MKVGILGGTFDPPHIAHLALAEAAREQLSLDSVLFIPAGEPWRKSGRAVTDAIDRLAMAQVAIEGNDAFGLSDIEVRHAGPTYTADTLRALAGERLDDSFWFIVGADALADLPNWHEPERIVQHAMLAVAPRGGDDAVPGTGGARSNVAEVPGIASERIVRFDAPRIDLSSSLIRERVRTGRSIRYLVPDRVRAYIEAHALYA